MWNKNKECSLVPRQPVFASAWKKATTTTLTKVGQDWQPWFGCNWLHPVWLLVFLPVCNQTLEHYLSPSSTTSIQAPLLVFHSYCVNSSTIAHSTYLCHTFLNPAALPLIQPCQFECNHLSPASTMLFQAWPLLSHSHHVNSSPIAQLLPPPHFFEPNCSCPTFTMSSWVVKKKKEKICVLNHTVPLWYRMLYALWVLYSRGPYYGAISAVSGCTVPYSYLIICWCSPGPVLSKMAQKTKPDWTLKHYFCIPWFQYQTPQHHKLSFG